MEIARSVSRGGVELAIQGRLDGYWADHLDRSLAETVREGHDRIRMDLSGVTFLSSAGIAVLMKFYKQLDRIRGRLVVTSASQQVQTVLEITRLAGILIGTDATEPEPTIRASEWVEHSAAALQIYDVSPDAALTCRVIGSDELLATAGFRQEHCVALRCPEAVFALGVGAIGGGFADCRDRFGEFLAVGGAAAYLPADGTEVPDYLVGSGSLAPELQVLCGLACEGRFARLARFVPRPGGTITLADLAAQCLELSGAAAAGVAIVAEAAGLVGAALRRSPVRMDEGSGLFQFPAVRSWLTFTPEPAFSRNLVLAVGIVARRDSPIGRSQLRPLDGSGSLLGHFHAAAFTFHPLKKGRLELTDTVATLFETARLLGVLHLLNDDRGVAGAGQSEFIRGACWVGPIKIW